MAFNCANANEKVFLDIQNHWAKENINRMLMNSQINGYPDGNFRPDNEITVLEFLKIIFNTLSIDLVEEGLAKWPDYYISTAQKYGIEKDFYKSLTRYEATEIISKLIDLNGVSTSNNKFKDLESKYKKSVLKLAKIGIINGYEDKTFKGENIVTRAEAVTIVLRCLDYQKEKSVKEKCDLNKENTNIGFDVQEKGAIDRIRYEIKNNKIIFNDDGRFSDIKNYSINEKYISNKKIISLIKTLVSDTTYTALYYVPSKYIINQIIIRHGESDNYINRGLDYYSFTYYEDKLYDLKRITLKEQFSNECYMKIDVKKLWNELYEFKKNNFVDDTIKEKFLNALKIEFENDVNEILEYILEKYNACMNKEYDGEVIVEQKVISKYIINFYKTDATSLEFYFEKLSS